MRQRKMMAMVIAVVMSIMALIPAVASAKSEPNHNSRPKITQKDIRKNSMASKMHKQAKWQKHHTKYMKPYRGHKVKHHHHYYDGYYPYYNDYYYGGYGASTWLPGVGYVYVDTVGYPTVIKVPAAAPALVNVPVVVHIR